LTFCKVTTIKKKYNEEGDNLFVLRLPIQDHFDDDGGDYHHYHRSDPDARVESDDEDVFDVRGGGFLHDEADGQRVAHFDQVHGGVSVLGEVYRDTWTKALESLEQIKSKMRALEWRGLFGATGRNKLRINKKLNTLNAIMPLQCFEISHLH
jgi:hypothetical protein